MTSKESLKLASCLLGREDPYSGPSDEVCLKPLLTRATDAHRLVHEAFKSLVKKASEAFQGDPCWALLCSSLSVFPRTEIGANPFEFLRSEEKQVLARKAMGFLAEPEFWEQNPGCSLREAMEGRALPEQESQEKDLCTYAAINVYVLACLSVGLEESEEDPESRADHLAREFRDRLLCTGFFECEDHVKTSGLSKGSSRTTRTKHAKKERWVLAHWSCFAALREHCKALKKPGKLNLTRAGPLFETKRKDRKRVILGDPFVPRKKAHKPGNYALLADLTFKMGCCLTYEDYRSVSEGLNMPLGLADSKNVSGQDPL